MFAPERISVPGPVFDNTPVPSIIPLKVRLVPAVSTWKAPIPPAAMVNFFVLDAVTPLYSKVPVVLLPPRITGDPLFPNSPLVLALLIVSIFRVPD